MSQTITASELAAKVGGTVVQGDPATVASGLNSLRDAVPGEISFLGNPRYLPQLAQTRATIVLVQPDLEGLPEGMTAIAVENPTLAFSHVIRHFGPASDRISWGVHSTAIVAESAQLNPDRVSIGPGVVVGEGVAIGNGTVLNSGAVICASARLGADCVIHANAVIKERCVLGDRVTVHSNSTIGTDGFGYELRDGRHQKIEQVGIVQIDADVEIGSGVTIDRARFGRTWIGEGTKIDNLVQIGHNCVIGKHCIIVSQTGISGSTRLGDYVTMGGQVGVAGHLEISSQVLLLAKSGVTKSIKEPGAYTGFPAKPLMEGRKMLTYPGKVPDLLKRVRELEERLKRLEDGGS